jgi:hypothetical protein
MRYDVVGDIHGHTRQLHKLLRTMGYRLEGGVFHPPDATHRVLFLGDFVDRGPEIPQAVRTVRAMVEAGHAVAILGNHEYNALCFHTERPEERHRWMRPRTDKNLFQQIDTLYQFRQHREEWEDHLRWFATLPLYLELPGLRAVHAGWDAGSIELLRTATHGTGVLNTELLGRGTRRGTPEFDALKDVLKGVEVPLPAGATFVDTDGNRRTEMRARWWETAAGKTYRQIAVSLSAPVPNTPVPPKEAVLIPGYSDAVPVFFGHYWLKGSPAIAAANAACLDFSVADGGPLVAYRWAGESVLTNDHLEWVSPTDTV